jgi:uncharacterized Fe-S cluster protein YjdI
MDKATLTKKYTNGEVTIVWKPGQCIHSAICWKHPEGLISVFNPSERPWIKPEGASTFEIIDQVKKCPSGALSYYLNENNEEHIPKNEEINATTLELLPNGPIKVSGQFCVLDPEGQEKAKNKDTYLCRCGASKNKPFCDGTHGTINFKS